MRSLALIVIAALSLAALLPVRDASAMPCGRVMAVLRAKAGQERVIAERFLDPIEDLQKYFRGDRDIEKSVEAFIKSDARHAVFKLEALFRIYEDLPATEGAFREFRQASKRLEDQLGAYSDSVELLAKAQSLKAPRRVLDYLKGQKDERMAQLRSTLTKDGWVAARGKETTFDKILDQVHAIVWPKSAEERTFVLEDLIAEAKRLRETHWDMNRLEGDKGIHDFRRKARWLLIEIQSLRGKVQLDPDAEVARGVLSMAKGPPTPAKYATFPVDDEVKKPILLAKPYYDGLTQISVRLGEFKDTGQFLYGIARAYQGVGLAKTTAQAQRLAKGLLARGGPVQDFEQDARDFYAKVRRTRFLKKLEDALVSER